MLRTYVHCPSSFRTKWTTNKLLLNLQRLQIILRGILYVYQRANVNNEDLTYMLEYSDTLVRLSESNQQ